MDFTKMRVRLIKHTKEIKSFKFKEVTNRTLKASLLRNKF